MARVAWRSDDPRAVETRRRLVDAFVTLSADGPEPALTVSELVDRAGLHRSSFYAHFEDIEELVLFVLDQQLDPVHEANLGRHAGRVGSALESNTRVISEILDQVSAPPGYLAAAIRHDRAMAEEALGRQLRDRVSDYYRRVPAYRDLAELSQQVSAEYIGHALSALICSWLVGEVSAERETLVVLISCLVPTWVMGRSPEGWAG